MRDIRSISKVPNIIESLVEEVESVYQSSYYLVEFSNIFTDKIFVLSELRDQIFYTAKRFHNYTNFGIKKRNGKLRPIGLLYYTSEHKKSFKNYCKELEDL